MILYNNRNTSSFRNHVVAAHKSIFSHFVSYMDGRTNIVAGDDYSFLEGIVETPLSCRKMQNDESSCTSAMANFFVRKESYGPNHPHHMEHEDNQVMILVHAYTSLFLV